MTPAGAPGPPAGTPGAQGVPGPAWSADAVRAELDSDLAVVPLRIADQLRGDFQDEARADQGRRVTNEALSHVSYDAHIPGRGRPKERMAVRPVYPAAWRCYDVGKLLAQVSAVPGVD